MVMVRVRIQIYLGSKFQLKLATNFEFLDQIFSKTVFQVKMKKLNSIIEFCILELGLSVISLGQSRVT